mmetsp:Transcript_29158/g.45685  ORF Transcript_29158/g.45685 Transcript_29158/m.45685 type:complete len:236 (-) Transcript_29158:1130-1837(-)
MRRLTDAAPKPRSFALSCRAFCPSDFTWFWQSSKQLKAGQRSSPMAKLKAPSLQILLEASPNSVRSGSLTNTLTKISTPLSAIAFSPSCKHWSETHLASPSEIPPIPSHLKSFRAKLRVLRFVQTFSMEPTLAAVSQPIRLSSKFKEERVGHPTSPSITNSAPGPIAVAARSTTLKSEHFRSHEAMLDAHSSPIGFCLRLSCVRAENAPGLSILCNPSVPMPSMLFSSKKRLSRF